MTTATHESPGFATRWKGLIFIGISLLVISLDNTILNIALPSLSRDLNASTSDLQWIVDAYTLVFAALLLTMGAVSDRYGRKRALQGGLILFGVGSLAAALSAGSLELILIRGFLGIAGALIMPSTLSIINVTFPIKERPQAIAIWAAIFGLGFGFGPVVAGALLQFFSWHSLFLINVPIVIIAVIGGHRFLVESRDETAAKIDLPGMVFSATGFFTLIYGIIQAGVKGWGDPSVLAVFALAIVLLGTFAFVESRTKEPMMPLYLFKNLSFSGASVALALVVFGLSGSLFFLSQYLQTILGYGTLEAGLGTLPLAVGMFVISPFSARVSQRIGIKFTVGLGIGLAALGLLYMGLVYKADTPFVLIGLGELILSVGLSLAMAPATNSIMSAIPADKSGVGSAMNDTTRELGGALGIAVLGTFMNHTYIDGVQSLAQSIPLLPKEAMDAIASSIQAAHAVAADARVPAAFAKIILDTANGAFVNGMTNAMLIGAGIMTAAVVFVLIVLPSRIKDMPQESEEVVVEPRLTVSSAPAGD